MLVLSRKAGESIQIGEDITVTVCRIREGQVRIGITAPRQIPVNRPELAQRAVDERKPEKDE